MAKPQPDLEARLSRLEAAVAELEAATDGPPPVVAAYAFLVERAGQMVASLMVGPDGGVYLGCAESLTSPRVVLGVGAAGSPFLAFADGRQVKRLAIEMSTNQCPTIHLKDGAGTARVRLDVDPRDAPSMAVADALGAAAAVFLVTAAGEPLVRVRSGEST